MAVQKLGRMRRFAPRRDAVFACLGKTRWASEEAAQRAISRIRAEDPEKMSSTVRPYRCSVCRKFHAGHGQ